MADIDDKENMSPVRATDNGSPLKMSSPLKPSKKARSRSIGPGGLEEMALARQRSPDKSRRRVREASDTRYLVGHVSNHDQSAMTQIIQLPPKSILPSKSEEQKRKEARRKSLGKHCCLSLTEARNNTDG